jgi:hypothetical protein
LFSRLAARVVTGPIAFALGGVLDIGAFACATLRARARRGRQ